MTLEPKYKEKIIAILTILFPKAKIYLFGSRARETHHERSDIDIAIDEGKEIRSMRIGEAKGMFEASTIPYRVDILDFHCTSDKMRSHILKEGILWKS